MRECHRPQLCYSGEAQSLPGLLFRLVYPDGETRDFLLDSWVEAAVFARYFDADLAFEEPGVVSPVRALSYEGFEDAMYIARARVELSRLKEQDDTMRDGDFIGGTTA